MGDVRNLCFKFCRVQTPKFMQVVTAVGSEDFDPLLRTDV
jgi:hypothetical protein